METPKTVMIFSNGNVAVFNDAGEQIAELQEKSLIQLWFEWLETKGINPSEIVNIETVVNGNRKYIQPIKTEEGRWTYRFSDF